MPTSTNQKFRDVFTRTFAPDCNATATTLVNAILNQTVRYTASQPLDASINTAGTYTFDQSTLLAMKATSFKVITHSTITSVNTNVAAFQLVYNNGNGGSDTVIVDLINTATTAGGGTGDITALIAYSFTINSTNQSIPAGSQVQVKVTKAGTGGLALPALSYEFKATAV